MLVMCSLPKRVSMWDVDVATAVELLNAKMARDAAKKAKYANAKAGKAAKPKAKGKTKAKKSSSKAKAAA